MLFPFVKYMTLIKLYLVPLDALVHANFLASYITLCLSEFVKHIIKYSKITSAAPLERHWRFELAQKADKGFSEEAVEKQMNSSS